MKEEIRKYFESQTKLNQQTIHNRELGMKLVKWLFITALIGFIIAVIAI